jgi:hypothetical protein
MTLPLVGHPVGAPSPAAAKSTEDLVESAYRVLLADAMPFGRNARVGLEHGGQDDSTERYRSVVWWYGLPGACLAPSDTLDVGSVTDEAAHGWDAPDASPVVTLTSRYEVGVDHVGRVEVVPTSTDDGRTIPAGTSATFRLAIPADNVGVMLRRRLDRAVPDQRAVVWIADDDDRAPFARAGVWYLAGSNVTVFNDAPTELGQAPDALAVSDRRWRDDEFLVARTITAGRSAIRVRLSAVSAAGVSAFRIWAYAWRLPPAP